MQGQSDDRTSDIRTRHKAVWRYICHDIWLCIKLHCQRQCPVIFGARSCLHTQGNFFLNHNSNALYRHMALEKSHDDRCGDIIWKICHYFDRSALIVFIRKFRNVQFQDIFIDHGYIFVICQRLREDRNQVAVDLHCHNFSGCLCQILRHRSDTRSDFQYTVILCDICRSDDLVQHMGIDQKILPEFLLKGKIIFFNYFYGFLWI